jgi:hypothetical protein
MRRHKAGSTDRAVIAEFLLRAAHEAGIAIGTDGYWLDIVPSRGMPRELYRSYCEALVPYREEIIAIIQRESVA